MLRTSSTLDPRTDRLHVRTAPGSSHFHATIPFNTLVQIERTTLGASAVDRWAYVVAPNAGAAGFVEEGFLMWDPDLGLLTVWDVETSHCAMIHRCPDRGWYTVVAAPPGVIVAGTRRGTIAVLDRPQL